MIKMKAYMFFKGEIPGWIRKITRNYVTIAADSWRGDGLYKITLEDVVKYYAHERGNFASGCRTIGSLIGDWRNIDYLAELLLEWFKYVNVKKLRQVSKEYGLTPKF